MQRLLNLEERLRFQISEDIYPFLEIVTNYDIEYIRYKILILKKGTGKIWFKFNVDLFNYEEASKKITKIAEVINERADDFLQDKLTPLITSCFYWGVSILDPKKGSIIVNGKEIKPEPGDIITYKSHGVYMWNGDCWYQYKINDTSKIEVTTIAPYSYSDKAPRPMKCECCGAIMENPYQCDYCETKYFCQANTYFS